MARIELLCLMLGLLLAACAPTAQRSDAEKPPDDWAACRSRALVPAPSLEAAVPATTVAIPFGQSHTRSIHETVLVPDDSDAVEPSFTLSPDDRHVAYITRDRRNVVLDGLAQSTFDRTAVPLCFSPDSAHLAYVAVTAGRLTMVVDGVAGKWFDGIDADGPIFSPDSRHLAYWAQEGGRWFVVLDGRELERHDGFLRWSLTFSPDGQHLAYAGVDGKTKTVVVDGNPGSPRDGIALGHPHFSPDSRRLAYIAATGQKLIFSVDGQDFRGDWEGFEASTLRFSPDSRRVGFVARVAPPPGVSITVGEPGKRAAVIDGQTGPSYDWVGPPVFSADGGRVAYAASRSPLAAGLPSLQSEFWVVADGRPRGPYTALGDAMPLFTPDGRLVYEARTEDGWRVVLDDAADDVFDRLAPSQPVLTPDGTHLAYGAQRAGQWMVVVDSTGSGAFDDIGEGTPVFSPDGRRVAVDAAVGSQWVVVVDGGVWPERYDATLRGTPLFSPDSRHVLSAVRKGQSQMLVVDGQAGTEYDTVLPYTGRVHFDAVDCLHYIAIRGTSWYLVEENLD